MAYPDTGIANMHMQYLLECNDVHIRCDGVEARSLALGHHGIDPVSVADLLLQGFVTPPYTAIRKLMHFSSGFERDASGETPFVYRDPLSAVPRTAPRRDDAYYLAQYEAFLSQAVSIAIEGARQPALLQSGGKDSTSLAIALAAVRPGTTCVTYVAGTEEDESASARHVAARLGLGHEVLVSEPGRAWDTYVDVVTRIPDISADFALLAYIDLADYLRGSGVDCIVDGVGSDRYFGAAPSLTTRALIALSCGWQAPLALTDRFPVNRSFHLCYLLSSLAMSQLQRVFPGSRFSGAEVDMLLGGSWAAASRARQAGYEHYLHGQSVGHRIGFAKALATPQAAMLKGRCTADAMGMSIAYPYTDERLARFIHHHLPTALRHDTWRGQDKILVRRHIQAHLGSLPYVHRKGSFRFDLRKLAAQRFKHVLDICVDVADQLPGAPSWLKRHRHMLDNKYFASKFYLLAIVAPWLKAHR